MLDLADKGQQTKIILHENFYKKAKTPKEISLLVLKVGAPVKLLIEKMGVVPITAVVASMIDGYCQQFNVSKNMTSRQIEDLALELCLGFEIREGNSVMLEELAIFFDRAARGEFVDPETGKKLVPFDRIDRGLIEKMMDVYFETDRTLAIWELEDAKRAEFIPVDDTPRLCQPGNETVPMPMSDIYTKLAGEPGALQLAKLIKEAEKKYGGQNG